MFEKLFNTIKFFLVFTIKIKNFRAFFVLNAEYNFYLAEYCIIINNIMYYIAYFLNIIFILSIMFFVFYMLKINILDIFKNNKLSECLFLFM